MDQLPDDKTYNDFVVGPGKIEIELAPGQSQVVDMTVADRLGSDKTFTVAEEDFQGTDDPNRPVELLGNDRGPYSLKDYINIASTSLLIRQGYKAHIPVTISIPADAQPGGLYGSVVVGTVSAPGGVGTQGATPSVPIITRIGTLFFVRVSGPVTESGHLQQFSLSGGQSVLLDSPSIVFDLTYKNDGDVYLDPSGKVTITNLLGSNVGSIDVDPWFAMPQSLRFREVAWNPPFLFGRYVAHAAIKRGYGSTTDEMDVTFWVIPWKIILAVFIGLLLLIIIIRWLVSHISFIKKKE